MSTLGHNNGPTMEAGAGWRKHCWTKARHELLPTLPIEILRVRVARAKELGLDYTSYASIRAASGHDVIAFLFSSNALRVFPKTPEMPADRLHKLAEITDCNRAVAVHRPLTPENLLPYQVLDHAFAAPRSTDTWIETRNQILTYLQTDRLPRDGVVIVGDTSQERAWVAAGRLAGYVPADQFFAPEGATP
ncbi:MAG: hypothetical protein AAED33_14640 [Paracoccaceae bacterium]